MKEDEEGISNLLSSLEEWVVILRGKGISVLSSILEYIHTKLLFT